jgi:hypothetical protein
MLALKDLVAKGKVVRFLALMAESLWYETEDGFAFPVPLSETTGATFLAEDKALMYMRFIRKYLPVASGLERGLAKSVASAGDGPVVRFLHFKDMEMWFTTADGLEFPVAVSTKDAISAVVDARKFAEAIEKHRRMLIEARQAA